MSKSKNYNRIVFLTTLSVYLGLVLVGGTAPVLAHSATTKSFDIKNEVEVKDDLDNKPDDCQEEERVAKEKLEFLNKSDNVFDDYIYSLKSILALSRKSPFDNLSFEIENFDYDKFDVRIVKPILFPKGFRKQITYNVKSILKSLYVVNYPYIVNYPNNDSVNIDFDFSSGNLKTTSFFPTRSNSDALKFSSAYNASLELGRCKSKNQPEYIIYENTKVSLENNQILIVTRLPRAGIDSLLK
ncbi:MAG: hypothetical protein ACR2N3_06300 [Pyrinomonadaceae bacterium]